MVESVGTDILTGAILLAPDNFTDCRQTPWAGEEIAASYKAAFFSEQKGVKIGESWEFSCDPIFPSQLDAVRCSLPELVRKFPSEILSTSLAGKAGIPSCEILVKLLNSAVPLSFQVHPHDGDESLAADECGKPESWLILKADPGAGIYLGFSKAISPEFLRSTLQEGNDLRPFMNFVPVKAGDYFEIQPEVPHAIGGGVTLLEPQRIFPGKSGKTYRIWDWGRSYEKDGSLAISGGAPRKLHVEEALRIIDPLTQVGTAFSDSCRRVGKVFGSGHGVSITKFPKNGFYQVNRFLFSTGGTVSIDIENGYAALTCLSGEIVIGAKNHHKMCVAQGRSALIPAASLPLTLSSEKDSDITIVFPDSAELRIF
jgi:mannose-6-phosphate isomerase